MIDYDALGKQDKPTELGSQARDWHAWSPNKSTAWSRYPWVARMRSLCASSTLKTGKFVEDGFVMHRARTSSALRGWTRTHVADWARLGPGNDEQGAGYPIHDQEVRKRGTPLESAGRSCIAAN